MSGSEDGTLRVWDCETGAYETTLRGHTNAVTSVAFAPPANGTALLASASTDTTVKIWQPTNSTDSSSSGTSSTPEDAAAASAAACRRTLLGHDHTVSCVQFAGAHTLVSASRDGTAKLWDAETGFCIRTLHGHDGWVRAVAVGSLAPGAAGAAGAAGTAAGARTLVATAGQDRTVRVWAADGSAGAAPVAVLAGHENVVETVCFAEAGGQPVVVSGGRDKTLRVWDLRTMTCAAVLEGHENWVRALAPVPGAPGLVCSAGNDRAVLCWDLAARRAVRTLRNTHKQFVVALAFCPTHGHLATGSDDATVKLWDSSMY